MRRSSKLLLFCAVTGIALGFGVLSVQAWEYCGSWPADGWAATGTSSVTVESESGRADFWRMNRATSGQQWIMGPSVASGVPITFEYRKNRLHADTAVMTWDGSWHGGTNSSLHNSSAYEWHTVAFTPDVAGYLTFYTFNNAGEAELDIDNIDGIEGAPTPTPTATNTPTPTSTPRAYTHEYGVYPPPVCSNLVTYGPGTDSVEYWTYYPFSPYYVEYRSLTGGAPGVLVERWRVDSADMVHSYVYGPFADGVTVVIEPESGSCGAWSRVEMMAVIHGETAITATVPLVRLEKLPWSAKWGNSFDHHGITSGSYAFGAYTAGGLYDAWVSWDITDTQRHDILFTCWGAIEWGSTTGQSQSYTCDGIPKNFDAGADISEFSASGQMGWIGQVKDYGYNPNDPTPTRFPQPTGTATPTACAGCTATPTPWLPASDPRGTATPTPWRTPGAPSVSTPVPVGTARSWIAAPGAYPTPGGNEYQAITDVVEFVTEVNCIDWVIPLTNNLPNGEFFANIPQGYTMCATTIQSLRLFQIDFMPMIIACGSLLVLGTAVNFLRDR
jgi:hypothetical protein